MTHFANRRRGPSGRMVWLLLGVGIMGAGRAGGGGRPVQAREADPPATTAAIATTVIEAPRVFGARLSPDARHVVYTVTRRSVADNHYVSELRVQSILPDGTSSEPPTVVVRGTAERDSMSFFAQWRPDGRSLTYFAPGADGTRTAKTLMRYELGSGRATPIQMDDPAADGAGTRADGRASRPRITQVPRFYRWSPSGRYLAFGASLGDGGTRPSPRVGVRMTPARWAKGLNLTIPDTQGLFVLEAETGRVQQLSPATLDVHQFAWAPDEQGFAITGTLRGAEETEDGATGEDLFFLDRRTSAVRPLSTAPGAEAAPVWSPDGHWVAFQRPLGVDERGQVLAVVPAAGGAIVRFVADDMTDLDGSPVWWRPDSGGFSYTTLYQMGTRLMSADLKTRRVTPRTDSRLLGEVQDLSADGRWLLVVRSSVTTPPELFLQALPDGAARPLTRLSPDFPLSAQIQQERVSWPSRDGKFTIHGVLLTPRADASGAAARRAEAAALPTLVFLFGGPTMVYANYAVTGSHEQVLTLAARGYAVLVPNTRGRGGYGTAFARGIRDGQSFFRLPFEDVMGGVDLLIQRGIADPARLGVFGHSYGGSLTVYTITQTRRFRAAINYEGAQAHLVSEIMKMVPGMDRDLNALGVTNPFAPAEMARWMSETTAFNLHCVTTPLLQLYGARGLTREKGSTFMAAFQRSGVPHEFILYDESHGFMVPSAKLDSIVRMGAWFDYWVRDVPYPDATLARTYDTWRATRPAEPPAEGCRMPLGSDDRRSNP